MRQVAVKNHDSGGGGVALAPSIRRVATYHDEMLHRRSSSPPSMSTTTYITNLELQGSTLLLLVTTELKVLTSLKRELHLSLADNTLESQDNLLGSLSLSVEDWLGLTTVTGLLPVVSSLTLGVERGLACLVLGHSVLCVLTALLALAVGLSGLWNVN